MGSRSMSPCNHDRKRVQQILYSLSRTLECAAAHFKGTTLAFVTDHNRNTRFSPSKVKFPLRTMSLGTGNEITVFCTLNKWYHLQWHSPVICRRNPHNRPRGGAGRVAKVRCAAYPSVIAPAPQASPLGSSITNNVQPISSASKTVG